MMCTNLSDIAVLNIKGSKGSKACDMECCTFFKVALQRIEDQTDNSIH